MQKEGTMTPESTTTGTVAGVPAGQPKQAPRRSFARSVGIFTYEMFTAYQHGDKRSVLAA
jgi:hypothetical protein